MPVCPLLPFLPLHTNLEIHIYCQILENRPGNISDLPLLLL